MRWYALARGTIGVWWLVSSLKFLGALVLWIGSTHRLVLNNNNKEVKHNVSGAGSVLILRLKMRLRHILLDHINKATLCFWPKETLPVGPNWTAVTAFSAWECGAILSQQISVLWNFINTRHWTKVLKYMTPNVMPHRRTFTFENCGTSWLRTGSVYEHSSDTSSSIQPA